MEEGTLKGDEAVARALGVEDAGEIEGSYMEAQFASDDMKMKEIDLSMKQISDSIQNDITRWVGACFGVIDPPGEGYRSTRRGEL